MSNLFNSVLLVLFGLSIFATAGAAELVFSPANPTVVVGQQITLSVSGTSGEITWTPSKGKIQGAGNQVTYIAPVEAGTDVVTVLDEVGNAGTTDNVGTVKIIVISKSLVSLENAVWKVFTNRAPVLALALSKDKKNIWVGTNGGLEKRKASTGELDRIYLNTDGLPDNTVKALLSDDNGGVWIGTYEGGVAHLKADGSWQFFNTDNSRLPSNSVMTIISDEQGGIWIGAVKDYTKGEEGGLAHLKTDGSWQVFNTNNSELPDNDVDALLSDGQGGVWVGTDWGNLAHLKADDSWQIFNKGIDVQVFLSDDQGGVWIGTESSGLAHLKVDDSWQVFNKDNSNLPSNDVNALLSDDQGGIWVGTSGITSEDGLAHFKADGSWQIFNKDNSNLPSNDVNALLSDDQGGIWVGTSGNYENGKSGLAHFKADGSWQVFIEDNSNIPYSSIYALLSDDQGEIWVGSLYGLAHLKADGSWQVFYADGSDLLSILLSAVNTLISDNQGGIWVGTWGGIAHFKADGSWQISNPNNSSNIPAYYVASLLSDAQGGVWIGTGGDGLTHFKADGIWQVFNTDNSELPENTVTAISGGQRGIWVGTKGGLAYLKIDDSWQVFNTNNSDLPDDDIDALLSDGQGGVWIGTNDGLAHLKADDSWQVFNKNNSNLPSNNVNVLLSDKQGGIWVGTYGMFGTDDGGLAHLKADESWQVFKTYNSNLPDNHILTLVSDAQEGIWVGTSGGLAHLTFSQKPTICTHVDEAKCNDIETDKRAAILIHPNGDGSGYSQELAIDFMATYAYHSLNVSGYDNDEIYFLSYKPDLDFNDDAQADFIVDAPVTLAELRDNAANRSHDITVDDIRKAFKWAKNKGKLDQPLIVIFVDHGWPNELLLNPLGTETLTADTFKILLDDYQNSTNNQVVVILEACHSGTFVPTLAAPDRLIISSTDEGFSYSNDGGRTSFLKFYFDNLRRGESFGNSIKQVTDIITKYSEPFKYQRPQLSDNTIAKNLCLNGCWIKHPGKLVLRPEKLPDITNLGQLIDLTVYTNTSDVSVKKVWASMITPEIANQRNEQGYSLQPTPFIPLSLQSTNTRKNDKKWQGSFSKFTTPGNYVVTFKAEDNNGFITDAPPIILTVTGEGLTHARFDATTNIVHIPAVTVGTDIYQADLLVRQFEPSIILDVDMNSLQPADDTTTVGYSNFTASTGEVYIPLLEVPNATAGIDT